MKARALVPAIVALALAAAGGASLLRAGWSGRDTFPHAQHARLFPLCTGCHAGATGGSEATLFPAKETCASCHDGKDLATVDWTAPRPRASNVRFSHADHASTLADVGESADCARCHTAAGATTVRATMKTVAGPQPQACIGCHAHQAPTHLAEGARCRTCHMPLAKAGKLDTTRIAALPKPAGHDSAGFVLAHGHGVDAKVAQGRCSICHTRESCERCHLNGSTVSAIAALDADARVALLASRKASAYPLPDDHRKDWAARHGETARTDARSCGNCHAQPGCRSCHVGEGAQQRIAQLPMPLPGRLGALPVGPEKGSVLAKSAPDGAGVKTLAFAPPRKTRAHPAGFADSHGPAAASGANSCTSCHAQSFCSSCHSGSSKPVFHPANFMLRHGGDAYGGSKNCGSCHNTESFCKSCHQGAGLTSKGRADVGFHNGQPMWLLQHGEAARKGLEGCTSCHKQQDCTRCHSASGGWGVNPHGSSFDASRMGDRNELVCARCHAATPGRNPQ